MKLVFGSILALLMLASCSASNRPPAETSSATRTGSPSETHGMTNVGTGASELVTAPKLSFSGVLTTRTSFAGLRLSWSVPVGTERVEIVWRNAGKVDSYFLDAFKKGDAVFASNLKPRFGNLALGKNEYALRAYVGTEIIAETPFAIDFAPSGCEFVYKKRIYAEEATNQTDKLKKLDGKIRKFSMLLPGKCGDRKISEKQDFSFNEWTFFLPSGIKVTVMDFLDAGAFGSEHESEDIIPTEVKRNLNGLDTRLSASINWPSMDPRTAESTWYDILAHADTLRFFVREDLTKQNITQVADEIRTILSTVEELPPETPVFDLSTVDLSETSVDGYAFVLVDKNGAKKSVRVDVESIYGEIPPEEFERDCRMSCSFKSLVGNRLSWEMDIGNTAYLKAVTDITTGKYIHKEIIDEADIQAKYEANEW